MQMNVILKIKKQSYKQAISTQGSKEQRGHRQSQLHCSQQIMTSLAMNKLFTKSFSFLAGFLVRNMKTPDPVLTSTQCQYTRRFVGSAILLISFRPIIALLHNGKRIWGCFVLGACGAITFEMIFQCSRMTTTQNKLQNKTSFSIVVKHLPWPLTTDVFKKNIFYSTTNCRLFMKNNAISHSQRLMFWRRLIKMLFTVAVFFLWWWR